MSVTGGEVIRHCERCDGESNHLTNFFSPHNGAGVGLLGVWSGRISAA